MRTEQSVVLSLHLLQIWHKGELLQWSEQSGGKKKEKELLYQEWKEESRFCNPTKASLLCCSGELFTGGRRGLGLKIIIKIKIVESASPAVSLTGSATVRLRLHYILAGKTTPPSGPPTPTSGSPACVLSLPSSLSSLPVTPTGWLSPHSIPLLSDCDCCSLHTSLKSLLFSLLFHDMRNPSPFLEMNKCYEPHVNLKWCFQSSDFNVFC